MADLEHPWPMVSVAFLVYNRRDLLRESLEQMLYRSDYDRSRLEVIVVDNASTDGSAAMVADEFPDVQLIIRDDNAGVSAWNDGFAVASGDFVLALDDDCYLPTSGLRSAVAAAQEHGADLVSFAVVSSHDRQYRFTEEYRTGLLSFWGCAVLMRRAVLEALGGYDPEIFVWANELEFMLRFFDRGFRHLHCPEIEAIHLKAPNPWVKSWPEREARINARHFGYIAAKLLAPGDAAAVLIALVLRTLGDGAVLDRVAFKALPDLFAGFALGLRRRRAVGNRELSRVYRRNFHSFSIPWWWSSPRAVMETLRGELARRVLGSRVGAPTIAQRRTQYVSARPRFYPTSRSVLEFAGPGGRREGA